MNPAMEREFGEGAGTYCYQYLRNLDIPCKENCKLSKVIHGATERLEYAISGSRTYDVVASPFTDSDGQVCQLAIFRNITQRKLVDEEDIRAELPKAIAAALRRQSLDGVEVCYRNIAGGYCGRVSYTRIGTYRSIISNRWNFDYTVLFRNRMGMGSRTLSFESFVYDLNRL